MSDSGVNDNDVNGTRMNNSADELIESLKGSLKESFSEPHNVSDLPVSSHETDHVTVSFQTQEEECTFPYSYVQNIRYRKGSIALRTSTAKVTIEGKNLENLYKALRRFKVSIVMLTPKNTPVNDQPIIDNIIVVFDEDKED